MPTSVLFYFSEYLFYFSALHEFNPFKIGKAGNGAGSEDSVYPPGLFFKHAGHRDKVVDFHWNAADPWTIVSVSEDGEKTGGGGTLQIWRMIDLIYRPEEEVIAELDKFKSHLSPLLPPLDLTRARLRLFNFVTNLKLVDRSSRFGWGLDYFSTTYFQHALSDCLVLDILTASLNGYAIVLSIYFGYCLNIGFHSV